MRAARLMRATDVVGAIVGGWISTPRQTSLAARRAQRLSKARYPPRAA